MLGLRDARARVAEMDTKFLPSVAAIREGEVDALLAELSRSPDLAADRSTCSHPTLMQCLALDGVNLPETTQRTMAKALLERGSPIDEPLIACASVGNLVLTAVALDDEQAPVEPVVLRLDDDEAGWRYATDAWMALVQAGVPDVRWLPFE